MAEQLAASQDGLSSVSKQVTKDFNKFFIVMHEETAMAERETYTLAGPYSEPVQPIQLTFSHPTSLNPTSILSSHLCLSLPHGLVSYSFLNKTLICNFLFSHVCHVSHTSHS
jgi:hypothetical protein